MALKFPTIYLLPTHIEADELPELESQIPSLTYNIHEAKLVLGRISKKGRAVLELRKRHVHVQEMTRPPVDQVESPPAKRMKTSSSDQSVHADGDTTASDISECLEGDYIPQVSADGKRKRALENIADSSAISRQSEAEDDDNIVRVVRLAWLLDSVAKGETLPIDGYLIYKGWKLPPGSASATPSPSNNVKFKGEEGGSELRGSSPPSSQRSFASSFHHPRSKAYTKNPLLVKETTAEHDDPTPLPPIPEYLHTTYSCQRPTPPNPPNNAFIEQLKEVRTIRDLEADQIGVRAYSTSIASLSAYPYLISHATEVARLPGCSSKIALLWQQWTESGCLYEVERAKADPKLSVLRLFYEIFGVAALTAQEFYNRGWRGLDDIIDQGWTRISRDQQIGIKYYDELQEKIPRAEVESIGRVILERANLLRSGFQMVIVGGYRRGKAASGDVDVILSHPDVTATDNFVRCIVDSLEKDEYITHTLTLSTRNSERGQTPVPWKGQTRRPGTGFDTLDKAMVVWQDPVWHEGSLGKKNPNLHRRVDIIISPWRTAGCAVCGWSGGTTFQRDLRRYCRYEKKLKFDSSGVRNLVNGEWVDLESDREGRPAPDMLTAEKRVFEGLGLEWRPPGERCTG